jgi:sucrose-6-phosphate hydrolase SacC (GH32 family)
MPNVVERMAGEGKNNQSGLYIKGRSFTSLTCVAILVFAYLITTTIFETSSLIVTMRNSLFQQVLIGSILSSTIFTAAAVGKAIRRSATCHSNHYPGPVNPSFETGLAGWTVISGDAFGNASVSSASSYWGGPFNQVGSSFLWGFAESGDPAVGQLRSSTFQASNVMSFLVGGGWDPVNLYVGLVRASDGELLLSQTGPQDEALIRIVWDTSTYASQNVYLTVYDNSTASSWGHINLDDVRTGCDALGDGDLTFNVLGQVNQPNQSTTTLSASQLYAIDSIRPQFHYTPYQGWINDPAGLIEWNGRHQLFSQFNPAAPYWGPMHWSHADSPDAVHWHELPVALFPPYPENPADASGRFTGSAVLDKDTGALQLIFTDSTDTSFHPDAVPEVVSSAKSTDGINFPLYSGNPIIAGPPAGSPSGFRDPKVFWDQIGNSWKMVVGSGDVTSGKVQLFTTSDPDLLQWSYVGVLTEGDGSTGTMWECPNFFPLDDKWVLFYGGDSVGWYEVGSYNGTKFTSEKLGLLDAGPDSYATQWYIDSAGRNLAITWMGNWPTSKWPSRINGWAGAQSVTRQLFIREDGGLGSKPIDEVSSLATGAAMELGSTNVHGTITVGSSNTARLQMSVDLASTNAPAFTVLLYSSSAEQVALTYTVANRTLTLDTTDAGYGQAGTWSTVIAAPSDNVMTMDLLIDRSSVEVFVGDGTAMTATVFPRYQESKDIKIVSHGGKTVFESVSLTPLGSTWI